MTTVVLVARRSDNGIRDAIWNHLRPRWAELGWEIVEGHHNRNEGPFNRSRATNRAARDAGDWDCALLLDADVWVEPARAKRAEATAVQTGVLSYAHTAWWGTTAIARQQVLDGNLQLEDWPKWIDKSWQVRNPLSNSCVMFVRRDLWDEIGGYDERFQGWGGEDWMWYDACLTLRGEVSRIDAPVIHLHHPLSEDAAAAHQGRETPVLALNHRLGRRWNAAIGDLAATRHLIAEAKAMREA